MSTEWQWLERFRLQRELRGLGPGETCIVRSGAASRDSIVETGVAVVREGRLRGDLARRPVGDV